MWPIDGSGVTGESSCKVGKKYCHNNSLEYREDKWDYEEMRDRNEPLTISPWSVSNFCCFVTFNTNFPSNIGSIFILIGCDFSRNILFIYQFSFGTFENLEDTMIICFCCWNRWWSRRNTSIITRQLNQILTVLSVRLDRLWLDRVAFEDFEKLNYRSTSLNQFRVHVSMVIDS